MTPASQDDGPRTTTARDRLPEPTPAEAGDDEELVDLVTVWLGLGIFAAKAAYDSVKITSGPRYHFFDQHGSGS